MGVLEMILTHLLLLFSSLLLFSFLQLELILKTEVLFVFFWSWSLRYLFEHPPLILLLFWHNLSHFAIWHSNVFRCLDSLFLLINSIHSSMLFLFSVFSRWYLHVSTWIFSMAMVLFINLILSFKRTFSAFLIMWWPLGVLMLLLSLILTGIMSLLRHLLWLEKSTILFSIFFHWHKIVTFSLPYSVARCIRMLLILFGIMYFWFSQEQNKIFQQTDKLLPVFKHAFLRSEENVNLNNLYTHGSVSVNIYLINFGLMADDKAKYQPKHDIKSAIKPKFIW